MITITKQNIIDAFINRDIEYLGAAIMLGPRHTNLLVGLVGNTELYIKEEGKEVEKIDIRKYYKK